MFQNSLIGLNKQMKDLPTTEGSRSTKRARGTCLLLAVSLKNVPKVLGELVPEFGRGGPVKSISRVLNV